MSSMTLDTAQRLLGAALSIARARAAPAMTFVVLDIDGALRAAVREDQASPAAADIAIAKARTALAFNITTARLGEIFGGNAATTAALASVLPGRFLPIGGAILLLNPDGHRIGAMAGAGSAPDTDAAIVQQAVDEVLVRAAA